MSHVQVPLHSPVVQSHHQPMQVISHFLELGVQVQANQTSGDMMSAACGAEGSCRMVDFAQEHHTEEKEMAEIHGQSISIYYILSCHN